MKFSKAVELVFFERIADTTSVGPEYRDWDKNGKVNLTKKNSSRTSLIGGRVL